jgi:CYTH domain-containing protein
MPKHKSGNEIEKVFKVRHIPTDLEKYRSEHILQGYLAIDASGTEVRLRQVGERFFETFKGSGRLQRKELEIQLEPDQFDALWPGTEGRRVEKVRYKIDHSGNTIELNLYRGNLEGLALAEIEFASRERSEKFQPPEWLAEDVTDDARYKNQSLAQRGAPNAKVTPRR